MSLCVASAGGVLALVAGSFSLSWTHSVEKTEWVEQWQVESGELLLVSAKVKGSGAGIELPEDAVWEGDGWRYTPSLPALPKIVLAASGMTPGGWSLCTPEQCVVLGDNPGEPVSIWTAESCTGPVP